MAALPVATTTQTEIGTLSNGMKILYVQADCLGTGAGAEVTATVTVTKLKRIFGITNAVVTDNADGVIHYFTSITATGNVITATLNADVGAAHVKLSGYVAGE